jgi:membrane protein implicated in regulation of membrane protease activity
MGEIPKSVFLRYLLMNVPGLIGFVLVLIIVRHWVAFPGWLFWVLIGCWIAKDVVLFPFVWRAYEPNESAIGESLIGKVGIVKKRLDPFGYIQVRGELWRAECQGKGPPIEEGCAVRIRKMEGLTLYVVPEKVD